MASIYGVEDVLRAILIELTIANILAAEAQGKDGELADMRADILAELGGSDQGTANQQND